MSLWSTSLILIGDSCFISAKVTPFYVLVRGRYHIDQFIDQMSFFQGVIPVKYSYWEIKLYLSIASPQHSWLLRATNWWIPQSWNCTSSSPWPTPDSLSIFSLHSLYLRCFKPRTHWTLSISLWTGWRVPLNWTVCRSVSTTPVTGSAETAYYYFNLRRNSCISVMLIIMATHPHQTLSTNTSSLLFLYLPHTRNFGLITVEITTISWFY